MAIPSYDDWMRRTRRGILATRSGELKLIDEAIKVYDLDKSAANKVKLRDALEAWKKTKGPDDAWKQSIRNVDDRVVEELDEGVKPYRAPAAGWTAPPIPDNPAKDGVFLAQSFECANSKEREDVPIAIARAKALIFQGYLNVVQARSLGPQRAIYERWFGSYDAGRFATVFDTVRALHDALHAKPVVLYYRGPKAQGPTDCAGEVGDIRGEDFFGAAWKPGNLPSQLDARFTYVFLGNAFFHSGIFSWDSIPGVVIHELSHAICGTDDVLYKGQRTYGPHLCQQLAREQPNLAIYNADNYEYLCENYQNKLFQPRARVFNLPPKASIALRMRAPT